ncbi:MAG: metallophosphoesterase [Candidatus Micrarchaeia archaeon]
MQKKSIKDDASPANGGKNGQRDGKNTMKMSGSEFERRYDCPFSPPPSLDDLAGRALVKLREATFTCDLEGLGMRRRLLERFRIPWEEMDQFRLTNGLAFEGFFKYCKKPGVFFSDGELSMNSDEGLRKEATKFFLRFDADKDGIIGPSDADARGYVTEDTVDECDICRHHSGDAPYGNRANGGLKKLQDQIDAKAEWTAKRIKENSRTIEIGERRVYCYDLQVHYLPTWLWGTRILHISDIHFRGDGRDASKMDFLASLPGTIGKAPEIVLITGDFITDRIANLGEKALAALGQLFPGAFRAFVLGNHDLRHGEPLKMRGALMEMGYLDLTNRHAQVKAHGFPINVFGMDDFIAGKPKMPSIPPEHRLETNILITHNLDAVNGAFPGSFDLILSGHTHAGEKNFFIFSGFDYLCLFNKEFLNRNNQKKEWKMVSQRTASYVNPGLGSHSGRRFNTAREGVALISLFG